jgi:Uma2 family endonuclease
MSAAALPRVRFTREDVNQMTDAGLFADRRFELIDGDLIDKMGQKPPHAEAIELLLDLLFEAFGPRRVRVQAPLEVSDADQKYNFPEPDLSVRAQPRARGSKRLPCSHEMMLVVEVADTTLSSDLTIKRDLYARAGVPEYWVLNMKGRKLIVHRDPKDGKYASTTTLTSRDTVSIAGQSIRIADMLP